MSKLHEVIKTLIDEALAINLKIELINTLEINENILNKFTVNPEYQFAETKILFSLQIKEYCIIKICSFVDEYEKFFTINYIEPKYKDKIIEVKQILKPFIKEIKREYDLKDYKNHILAHNLRDNSRSIVLGEIERDYNFPKNPEEFNAIKIIIHLIIRILATKFEADLPENYWDDKVINTKKIVINRTPKIFDIEGLKKIANSHIEI